MNNWGVATLADEPGMLIAAFAAYHLELGAAQVQIMLDRPNEDARDLLSGVNEVVLCDAGADGWDHFGPRSAPVRHLGRQKYHASRVLQTTALDWILHCDVDEFLVPLKVGGMVAPPVSLLLSLLPSDVDWGRISVAEKVWVDGGGDVFGGPFRLPWSGFATDGATIYSDASMMQLKMGLSGHNLGKAIARSGRGSFMGIHQPMRDYQGHDRTLVQAKIPRMRILHYDGLTVLHYALKMMRRALADMSKNPPPHSDHRRMQFNALAGAQGDLTSIREQWDSAKQVTAKQADHLRDRNLLWDYDPQIIRRGTTTVPALAGFSAREFDATLIARETDLISRAHKTFGFDPVPLMSR